MWLFDDILKKPQETAPVDPLSTWGGSWASASWSGGSTTGGFGWGKPPVGDPPNTLVQPITIQKTPEVSLFGAEIATSESMTTVKTPEMPQVHAEESPSWLLVRTEAPQNSSLIATPSVWIASSETLMPTQESPLILTPEASRTAELTLTQEENSITTTPSTPIAETEAVPVETNTEASPLFAFGSMESETKEEPVTAPEVTNIAEETPLPTRTEASTLSGQKIFHPKEFIEKSITDIDVMIGEIDQAHGTKIQEAEWYRNEKKHFAELEKAAYGEARTLDDEKAHALHVRDLLEGELGKGLDALQKNHTSASVETAMTGIAVQNTVTETIESKKGIHKKPQTTHKKKETSAA